MADKEQQPYRDPNLLHDPRYVKFTAKVAELVEKNSIGVLPENQEFAQYYDLLNQEGAVATRTMLFPQPDNPKEHQVVKVPLIRIGPFPVDQRGHQAFLNQFGEIRLWPIYEGDADRDFASGVNATAAQYEQARTMIPAALSSAFLDHLNFPQGKEA